MTGHEHSPLVLVLVVYADTPSWYVSAPGLAPTDRSDIIQLASSLIPFIRSKWRQRESDRATERENVVATLYGSTSRSVPPGTPRIHVDIHHPLLLELVSFLVDSLPRGSWSFSLRSISFNRDSIDSLKRGLREKQIYTFIIIGEGNSRRLNPSDNRQQRLTIMFQL